MPTVDILNTENKKVGALALNDAFTGTVKENLFYETVKMQLANRRRGTASTKTRAYVSGGGVKPWKQKGTGRARAGSIRSPLWRGALISGLALKVKDGRLKVLDNISLTEPKTKGIMAILKKINSNKGLIVIDGANPTLGLAARNLKDFKLLDVNAINIFDLLKYDDLIITKLAMEKLERNLLR